MVCLPCAAAAGPPGIAVAAVGTVGYGVYKSTSPKKKNRKKKKLTKKKKKKGGAKKFKKGEVVNFVLNTGANKNMKFVRNISPNRVTLKFLNKKGTMNVDINRVKKIPKTIANTKKRQKTKRAKLVRKKRGIKTQSSTLELPKDSEEDIDDLLKDMKI
mgnify:FL=1|tara:strand:+ start:477 stop:950 length:474 start_codon:yes stop_codon:yes gene_type:complete